MIYRDFAKPEITGLYRPRTNVVDCRNTDEAEAILNRKTAGLPGEPEGGGSANQWPTPQGVWPGGFEE